MGEGNQEKQRFYILGWFLLRPQDREKFILVFCTVGIHTLIKEMERLDSL